jgi:hypothetical protein
MSRPGRLFFLTLWIAACDGEMPSPDAGPDAGRDGGPVVDCDGAADGTPCGDDGASICLSGACEVSECGDGFVDTARGEECDDENAVASDGCEGTCQFTCDGNDDCDNGLVCDGAEACVEHRCAEGTPASDGTPCSTDEVASGVCHPLPSPVCQAAECGNGVRDAEEECDDGRNGDDADGCGDDCLRACPGGGCTLLFSPEHHDFGSLLEGTASLTFTFTVQNTGANTTGVPAVEIVGADASHFLIVTNGCNAPVIPAFDTCDIEVRFAPTGAGARRAMLVVRVGTEWFGAAELRGFALGDLAAACTDDGECAGGHCTDGVCCEASATDCGGCNACNVSGSEGTCAAVPDGEDPHGECDDECEDRCDGTGACRPDAEGTVCLTEGCTNRETGFRQFRTSWNGVHECDGTSTACPTVQAPCAGHLVCDSSTGDCRTTCSLDAHCELGYFCSGGACMAGRGFGGSCSRDAECQQGYLCAAGSCAQCASSGDCQSNYVCSGGSCYRCDIGLASCPGSGWGDTCGLGGGCTGCTIDADCPFDTAPFCLESGGALLCRCAGGVCQSWQECVGTRTAPRCASRDGVVCLDSSECASGSCVDNICS